MSKRLKKAIYIGTQGGKKQYKYVYAQTQKELDMKYRQVKAKLDKGLDVTAERDTFGYWLEKWLKSKKRSVSTGRGVAYTARAKNFEPIEHIPITKLRGQDIQDMILNLADFNPNTGKPMAKSTLKEVKQVAVQVIDLAISNRVLDYNCAKNVLIPSDSPKETKFALTDEQQGWINDTPHRAQIGAMIMLYAGLRRGELVPLIWQDIDFANGTISVTKSIEYVNGRPVLKPGGKTEAANRIVYIPQKLLSFLKPLQGAPFELVLPSAKHKMLSSTAWTRLWDSYLTDLNLKYGDFGNNIVCGGKSPTSKYAPKKIPFVIPRITAHCLRHTYITMLYKSGVDVLTAKELAGHKDIQTTLGIYTHLDAEHKKKNIDKLNQFLG